MGAQLLPLILLAPVLVAVAVSDLRHLRIPNQLGLVALAIFLVTAPLVGWPEIAWRALAGGVVFCAGFTLFALRLLGGGDVKMLAALMLFVPTATIPLFSFGLSAALMLGVALVVMLRALPRARHSTLASMQAKGQFPMGISIAMAGLAHPVVVALLG